MKLTKSRLKQIIKEELSQLKEFGPPVDEPDPSEWTDPPEEEDPGYTAYNAGYDAAERGDPPDSEDEEYKRGYLDAVWERASS